jgi:hypothetical protein
MVENTDAIALDYFIAKTFPLIKRLLFQEKDKIQEKLSHHHLPDYPPHPDNSLLKLTKNNSEDH